MTVQELIDELKKIKNKYLEVKFISNKTLEDMVIVDRIENYDSYDFIDLVWNHLINVQWTK